MSIKSTQAAADAEIVGAFGIAIVSDQAAAAGAASIPGPWSNADWDGWFVWEGFAMSLQFSDATGVFLDSVQSVIDSKAMRRVGDNDTIVAMCESQAVAFEIACPLRQLFKLS